MIVTRGEAWRKGVKRNQNIRLPWRRIVGKDLTKWCYMQFSARATKEHTLNVLLRRLREFYERSRLLGRRITVPLPDAVRRARISVSARWAEYNRRFQREAMEFRTA